MGVRCLKYIDDGLLIEKVNMKEVPLLEESDTRFKDVHPAGIQDLFDHTVRWAEERGMQVNAAKTGLICVSGAISFEPRAHLYSCLLYTSPSPRDS